MRVVIAGGHGQIALRLCRLLAGAGAQVDALVRSPAHAQDVADVGGRPVVFDLEHEDTDAAARVVAGADAAVFAAGAGAGSGPLRKYTVDLGGSVLLAQACERAGVRRFVQISTMGAGGAAPAGSDESWAAYLDAKTKAEDDLRGRELDATIVRPGGLTDGAGTGLVALAAPPLARGSVARQDVAAVLAQLLLAGRAGVGMTLELTAGPTPIADAVAALPAGLA